MVGKAENGVQYFMYSKIYQLNPGALPSTSLLINGCAIISTLNYLVFFENINKKLAEKLRLQPQKWTYLV